MKLLKFLISKIFLINIGIAVIIVLLSILGFFRFLDWYTHHGESMTIPDMTGQSVEEAKSFIEERGLRYEVTDSVYHPDHPEGAIVEHNPPPSAQVKRNRRIYLTINAGEPPMVEIPELVDVSLRQAMRILQSRGIKVGELIYEPDIAQNVVLGMQYQGQKIDAGKEIPQNERIDLILGDGMAGAEVEVPDLTGLTLEEAMFVLNVSGLNTGNIHYDADVEDTTNARIYSQVPAPPEEDEELNISHGEAINLYLSSSAPDESNNDHNQELDDFRNNQPTD